MCTVIDADKYYDIHNALQITYKQQMYNTRIKSYVVQSYSFWTDQNMTLLLLAQTSTARFTVE